MVKPSSSVEDGYVEVTLALRRRADLCGGDRADPRHVALARVRIVEVTAVEVVARNGRAGVAGVYVGALQTFIELVLKLGVAPVRLDEALDERVVADRVLHQLDGRIDDVMVRALLPVGARAPA